jgi:hypothetical protein
MMHSQGDRRRQILRNFDYELIIANYNIQARNAPPFYALSSFSAGFSTWEASSWAVFSAANNCSSSSLLAAGGLGM